MILPSPKDAKHKAWLYRLLGAIYDDPFLASALYFKGGTCAAMRGFLDRFSVDLDFDYVKPPEDLKKTRKKLEIIFGNLELDIKDKSQKVPQYFLKYPAKVNERNTLKIDVTAPPQKFNQYEPVRLAEIDRIVRCQTIETMFANKLVALIERWERNGSIAGRDLYDVHYFFLNGFRYDEKIITERRRQTLTAFLKQLIKFIEEEITQTVIDQDINILLRPDKFQKIRKVIKPEVLMFLNDELKRLPNLKPPK